MKQDLRDCPLCGVRMRDDPGGRTVKLETHVHEAKDETCLLPNATEEEAAKAQYRSIMEQQHRAAEEKALRTVKTPAWSNRSRRSQEIGPKKFVGALVVLAIYVLMKACGA